MAHLRFRMRWTSAALAVSAGLLAGCGDEQLVTPDANDGLEVQQVDALNGPEFRWVGNGQRTLGTIRVTDASTLRWTNNTGYSFDLRYDDADGTAYDKFVSTSQREGSVPVEPGVYRNI